MKKAIYAGSFDPLTNGHQWVINEGLNLFHEVYIVIAHNPSKKYYFTLEERKKILEHEFKSSKVKIVVLQEDYVAQYAKENGISHLIRGLRNNKDFDFEKTVQTLNQLVSKDIKTVYLIPPANYSEISSSNVKSLVGFPRWQTVISSLVNSEVISHFQKKIYENKIRPYWDALNIKDDDSFQSILNCYSKPGRHYHNLEHLEELLTKSESADSLIQKDLIYLSILFHDIVYEPKSHKNEEDSAEVFLEFAKKNKLGQSLTQRVKEFILATQNHANPTDDPLLSLFLDLDLSILGSEARRFQRYEEEIRQEYHFVPEDIYLIERSKIMKSLSKDTFKTQWATSLWDKQKNKNLSFYK